MGAAEEAVLALVEGVVAEESIAEDGEHICQLGAKGWLTDKAVPKTRTPFRIV